MTRWAFILGSGRSGTTLLSDLLGRSPEIYIAPETKYFQQVWSQRHLLRLLPEERRIRAIVDHLIAREYPADPPTFAPRRRELEEAVSRAPGSEAGFLHVLRALSDRPLLGEKTPWHTFFVDRILSVAPEARFVAITRDAPATVASLWRREGFRRVDTLTRCIARWIVSHEEIVRLAADLGEERLHLLRFEDLVRDPEPVLRRACRFLDTPFDGEMLTPTFQDSSLRSPERGPEEEPREGPDEGPVESPGREPERGSEAGPEGRPRGGTDREAQRVREPRPDGGWDPGVLDRWRTVISASQLRRIRSHTRRLSRQLGYSESESEDRGAEGGEPARGGSAPGGSHPAPGDRARVALEVSLLRLGIRVMRSGFYPFGAATSNLRKGDVPGPRPAD